MHHRPADQMTDAFHTSFLQSVAPFLLAFLAISGCSISDNYGTRAVQYNIEAENARNQGLLLNIIRAAHRKPLQFTDLTTVTGQTNSELSLGFNLPFAASPSSVDRTFVFSPNASVSGGPNFNVAVLNNKEFYSGIMTPISMPTIAFFEQEGIRKALLLSLVIGKMDYGPAEKAEERAELWNNFRPAAGKPSLLNFDDFKTVLEALINAWGLRTETFPVIDTIGVPLSEAELRHPEMLKILASGEIKAIKIEQGDDRGKYRLQRSFLGYRFCFDAKQVEKQKQELVIPLIGARPTDAMYCGKRAPEDSQPSAQSETEARNRFGLISQHSQSLKLAVPAQNGNEESRILTITPRSVEGIIYYLGELARKQLGLDGVIPSPKLRLDAPNVEAYLFTIKKGNPDGLAIAATYEGSSYFIPVDPQGNDRSSQVLNLLSQLLALNSSAKDLPTPTVIPVIAR